MIQRQRAIDRYKHVMYLLTLTLNLILGNRTHITALMTIEGNSMHAKHSRCAQTMRRALLWHTVLWLTTSAAPCSVHNVATNGGWYFSFGCALTNKTTSVIFNIKSVGRVNANWFDYTPPYCSIGTICLYSYIRTRTSRGLIIPTKLLPANRVHRVGLLSRFWCPLSQWVRLGIAQATLYAHFTRTRANNSGDTISNL